MQAHQRQGVSLMVAGGPPEAGYPGATAFEEPTTEQRV